MQKNRKKKCWTDKMHANLPSLPKQGNTKRKKKKTLSFLFYPINIKISSVRSDSWYHINIRNNIQPSLGRALGIVHAKHFFYDTIFRNNIPSSLGRAVVGYVFHVNDKSWIMTQIRVPYTQQMKCSHTYKTMWTDTNLGDYCHQLWTR